MERNVEKISIHSPYTGRDCAHRKSWFAPINFNPLSLYRERLLLVDGHKGPYIFQSTLPIQGETLQIPKNKFLITFQSTLPIQGETTANCILLITVEISIHSPYTGRDSYTICLENAIEISIHSPYTGRDMVFFPFTIRVAYFNPLSLYRERRWKSTQKWDDGNISIHSPYTGRDIATWKPPFKIEISIHSPYTGRDARFHLLLHRQQHFNPLSLYRERQNGLEQDRMEVYFNPLSLYRERQCDRIRRREWQRFQSTLPIQGETVWRTSSKKSRKISIHSPYTGRDEWNNYGVCFQ